jgi:superfamily II DNA or RNA helicase
MSILPYLQYEYQCINEHIKRFNAIAWHWSHIPEDELYEAGWIHSFNKLRLSRKNKKIEGKDTSFREYGLDGLAKCGDVYHGIQAKYWTKRYLTAKDIGTFTVAIYTRMIHKNPDNRGYLYHTCSLQVDLRDDFKNCGKIIPIKMAYEQDDFIVSCETEKNLPLYDFQKDALCALEEDWSGMGLLQLPCGCGKTTILGHHLSQKSEIYNVIVVLSPLRVHSKQILERIKGFFDVNTYTYMLVDSDIDGTRDIESIKENITKTNVLISATFKSAEDVLTEVFDDIGYENMFLVVDEAHNLVSNDNVMLLAKKAHKCLLLTATPCSIFEDHDVDIIYKYPFSKAIEAGYICDYRIYLPIVEKVNIPTELDSLIDREEITGKAMFLVTGMLRTGSRRCIVYMRSCEECDAFMAVVKKVVCQYHSLPLWIDKIDNKVDSRKRTEILQDFQDGDDHTLRILTSVRILDEGIDIVRCDSVFISHVGNKANDIRMVQRICRANRKDQRNKAKVASCFLWCDDMNDIVNCFTLLKEDDNIKFTSKIRVISGDYDNVGELIVKNKEKTQQTEVVDYINIKCLSLEERAMMRAKALVDFYKDNNRFPSSISQNEDEKKLGQWLSNMRTAAKGKRRGTLYDSVKQVLNDEIPHWLETEEDRAIKNAKALVDFYKDNNRFPSKHSQTEDEKKLGRWLVDMRLASKGIGSSTLYDSVKQLLNDEIPHWLETEEDRSIKNAKALLDFYKGNNRFPSSISQNEDEKKLGQWLSNRRTAAKCKGHCKLYDSVKQVLNDEIPHWLETKEDIAIKNAEALVDFYKDNNRFPNSNSENEDEKKLGQWLSCMRAAAKGKGSRTLYDSVKQLLNDEISHWL